MLVNLINRNAAKAALALRAALVALALSGCSAMPAARDQSAPPAPASTPIQAMTREDAVQLAQDAERALAAGRLVDGGAAYVRIVTVFPDDAYAWFRLGTVYLRTGQYGAAQMACERALRLDPAMAKAQANLALAHLYQFRAAAQPAIASPQVAQDNRRALAALLRDVDHALAPEAGP
jgi:tetratricopeptide (TPR) repeat protein